MIRKTHSIVDKFIFSLGDIRDITEVVDFLDNLQGNINFKESKDDDIYFQLKDLLSELGLRLRTVKNDEKKLIGEIVDLCIDFYDYVEEKAIDYLKQFNYKNVGFGAEETDGRLKNTAVLKMKKNQKYQNQPMWSSEIFKLLSNNISLDNKSRSRFKRLTKVFDKIEYLIILISSEYIEI